MPQRVLPGANFCKAQGSVVSILKSKTVVLVED